MKDIKELIYAAVEENAVVFQELAGGILQARAYDAIESLRPEVGASMFGESSHMKGKDDEDEEMEDEEDEDEDEEEIKESVREYLNQKGTGKSAEGYDDAGMWDRQTAEKHAAKHGGKLVPDPSGKHLVKLPGKKKMQEALHPNQQKIDVVDDEKIDAKDFAKLRATKKNEEVEVDEAVRIRDRAYSSIERGHGDDKTTFQGQMDRAHIAAGAKARRQRTGPGVKGFNSAMRSAKASDGYQPRETGSVRAKNEEVEGLDELSTEKLLKYREAAKKDADVKNKAWDKKKLSDEGKYKLMNRETGTNQADQKIKRKTGSYRPGILARVGARLRNEEVEQIDEVDYPKNQADMLAHIMHQIKVSGHPVATDAQFRATNGKDTTKKASLEPGQDKLQYTIAQGGNVKP